MDKFSNSPPPTDSYYFRLYPSCFKVEHNFAKTIKPNTSYKLTLFKGLQKVDEMPNPIKAKLIGGRIHFDDNTLTFYLPLFSPARNIEFTLKVLEVRGLEETEIASHRIRSSDYIKSFRATNASAFRQQALLLDSFTLFFDLFVNNSKTELDNIFQLYRNRNTSENRPRTLSGQPKATHKPSTTSEKGDGSDLDGSASGIQEEGLTSSRKLARRRGHDGKLRSKQTSRENSDVESQRGDNSHTSSPKRRQSVDKERSFNLVRINRKDSNSSQTGRDFKVNTPTKQASPNSSNRGLATDRPVKDLPATPQSSSSPTTQNDFFKITPVEFQLPFSPASNAKFIRLNKPQLLITNPSMNSVTDNSGSINSPVKSQTSCQSPKQVPLISINGKPESIRDEHELTEIRMKYSQRAPAQLCESRHEDNVLQEYEQLKDTFLFVLFFIASLALFYNALTPSRKV